MTIQTATFAAGCFWQVEATFRAVKGVKATRVGYTGGSTEAPTYEQVCSGRTGHAEAVEVDFDPDRVTYAELVSIFFDSHDPTQLNRQGPDIGDQYRSAIFVHDDEQKQIALEAMDERQRARSAARPIVTQIVPATAFTDAEDYHQQYLEKRGLATCRID